MGLVAGHSGRRGGFYAGGVGGSKRPIPRIQRWALVVFSLAGWSAPWADTACGRWFSRHCVTAFCGLRPLSRGCAPVPRCKERCLLTILSGPRPSYLLASLALRASLRLLLPLVVSSFTKANKAYAAKGHPCPYPLVWNHPNDAIGFAKRRAGTNGPGKTAAN